MKLIPRLCLILASCAFTPGCGVDSRWGPPRSGLRQNMAWQYASSGTVIPGQFTIASQEIPHSTPASAYAPIPMPSHAASPGKVTLSGKYAQPPGNAPDVIHRAVRAGNQLQSKGYRFGGGHAVLNDTAYDCSGTVSYVLREAGLMEDQMPSRGFLNYGEPGEGNWITVWAKDGHVFMTIGGLRLDTGGNGGGEGPRWRASTRSKSGFIPRHPRGL